jgi:hypothetical protein
LTGKANEPVSSHCRSFHRWRAESEKSESQNTTVEVESKHEEISKNEVKVVTRIIKPDGTRITRAKTQARTEAAIQTDRESKTQVIQKNEIVNRRSSSITALIGLPLGDIAKGAVYGAAFQKQFIGPLLIGAFAFTDLRVGLTVGIEL